MTFFGLDIRVPISNPGHRQRVDRVLPGLLSRYLNLIASFRQDGTDASGAATDCEAEVGIEALDSRDRRIWTPVSISGSSIQGVLATLRRKTTRDARRLNLGWFARKGTKSMPKSCTPFYYVCTSLFHLVLTTVLLANSNVH